MLSVMIVEDSRLARLELSTQLQAFSDVQLVAQAASVNQAQQEIVNCRPDVLFLDINLPGGDGFSFLESLPQPPLVVFTTAYSEHALKAFEVNAVDYLLKPIEPQRLAAALQKCRQQLAPQRSSPQLPKGGQARFFIKDGEQCHLVQLDQVRYFQAVGNYCQVYFAGKHPMMLSSLNRLEETLDPELFFRANRHQLINLNAIANIAPTFHGRLLVTLSCGTEIELSQRQSSKLRQVLSL
ncbi:LytR/AlgR family response regulator transcription factor [Shewanella sedimentimangrovi]|uniref:Response regulator transcription factor n=1 Tax=Shewanella sedimentimangrovi TaxID=2814293 RepID=A0ABX7R463_9GAMM|nr:LytTR family DNA-binding domain-containing protein [Shewanella sedimentimangrovi]QSX38269.1 response regulator transcription factor [Shewanella sedimentimangrovi]